MDTLSPVSPPCMRRSCTLMHLSRIRTSTSTCTHNHAPSACRLTRLASALSLSRRRPRRTARRRRRRPSDSSSPQCRRRGLPRRRPRGRAAGVALTHGVWCDPMSRDDESRGGTRTVYTVQSSDESCPLFLLSFVFCNKLLCTPGRFRVTLTLCRGRVPGKRLQSALQVLLGKLRNTGSSTFSLHPCGAPQFGRDGAPSAQSLLHM
jgi:hypothetical protein